MSDEEGSKRGDGKLTAFLLGFVLGVIVCLGAGSSMYAVFSRREMAAREEANRLVEEAMRHEMRAREAAEAMAVAERARAERELAAKEAAKNAGKEKKEEKKE